MAKTVKLEVMKNYNDIELKRLVTKGEIIEVSAKRHKELQINQANQGKVLVRRLPEAPATPKVAKTAKPKAEAKPKSDKKVGKKK